MSQFGCMGTCKLHSSGQKPERCNAYPSLHDYMPSKCTYYFEKGRRMGSCKPNVCQEENCCAIPREGGEPMGTALEGHLGGKPCKFLEWSFVPERIEKHASAAQSTYKYYKDRLYKAIIGE